LATSEDNWVPIRADQLRVGHYIKINHSWFDHPFVRRIFRITSEEEVAIIRNGRLTRLYVDREQSTPARQPDSPQRPPDEEQRIAERVASLKAEKIAQIDRIQEHRAALEAVRESYSETVSNTAELLGMLESGDPGSVKQLGLWVGRVVETVINGQPPLALVALDTPADAAQRVALLATDAVGICGVLGRRMGLDPQQLMALTTAAAVHGCGLQRLPAPLMDETPGGMQRGSSVFQRYPAISAEILKSCGGFPQTIQRIVHEHRERPDGKGFPQGLAGDAIHPLALMLGAVREFQVQCRAPDVEPTAALAWLFRELRPVYGEQIIDQLISSTTVYPPGTFVELSDGSAARVLRVNEADRMRPVVGILDEEGGEREMQILDLLQEPQLSIRSVAQRPRVPASWLAARKRSWYGMGLLPAMTIPVVAQAV
jgi:HD-GYP domain-containing protein (c-di-GMP phosphodiesterase class II)